MLLLWGEVAVLSHRGYSCHYFENGSVGIQQGGGVPPDVCILHQLAFHAPYSAHGICLALFNHNQINVIPYRLLIITIELLSHYEKNLAVWQSLEQILSCAYVYRSPWPNACRLTQSCLLIISKTFHPLALDLAQVWD